MTILTTSLPEAYARAEECEPGSAWKLSFLLYYRECCRQYAPRRILCTGRVINGGSVQIDAALTAEEEYQFCIVDNEKLSKPGLDPDPDFLRME
jgi:hypothetical protein